MVLPVLAAAAVAAPVAAGLFGYLNSKQAAEASASERAKIQALLNKVSQPDFDINNINAAEYKLIGKYSPQTIPLIEENAPQLVQESEEAKAGKQAQLDVLRRLMSIGQAPTDVMQQGAVNDALRQAAIQNQGAQGAIEQSFARRGVGGSGLEMARALSAQQASGQTGALAGQQAAMDAYRNRLMALSQGANLGGNIYGQETQQSARNADIINAYNQRIAAQRQGLAGTNVGIMNEAQLKNLGMQQDIANRNVGLTNERVTEQNRLKQAQYQNELDKIRIQAGQSESAQRGISDAAAQQNQALMGIGGGLSNAALYGYSAQQQQPQVQQQPTGMTTNPELDYRRQIRYA